jgi:SAM-dependent methyltransferase
MSGEFDYDLHGDSYAEQRRPDPRIGALLDAALGDAPTLLNVGAGAGSYEPSSRYVIAIEPSAVMRRQRPAHLARAVPAIAERLPLAGGSVDAAMAIFTVHHWSNPRQGLRELRRVTRGPVVVMTLDPDLLGSWWFGRYIPELIAAERGRFLPIEAIRSTLGEPAVVQSVPVPFDCTDGFVEAFYGRPERLLDPAVREAQSIWSFGPATVQDRFVAELGRDLQSGAWDREHGKLRRLAEFDGGLRLVIGSSGSPSGRNSR